MVPSPKLTSRPLPRVETVVLVSLARVVAFVPSHRTRPTCRETLAAAGTCCRASRQGCAFGGRSTATRGTSRPSFLARPQDAVWRSSSRARALCAPDGMKQNSTRRRLCSRKVAPARAGRESTFVTPASLPREVGRVGRYAVARHGLRREVERIATHERRRRENSCKVSVQMEAPGRRARHRVRRRALGRHLDARPVSGVAMTTAAANAVRRINVVSRTRARPQRCVVLLRFPSRAYWKRRVVGAEGRAVAEERAVLQERHSLLFVATGWLIGCRSCERPDPPMYSR